MKLPHPFHGLIAPTHTPFEADGRLAPDVIKAQAGHLRRVGVKGVFVCGSTGEGPSLTGEERRGVAERWVASAGDDLSVIVQVGHASLEEAKALARHAEAVGADAVAALPPFYFKPATVADLAACCRAVAGAAPRLPFFYYHIPSLTGVRMPMRGLLELVGDIPNFAGLKFTHDDLDDFAACVRFALARYQMFFGRDEMLLSALRLGATGAVGSTYNFAAPLYQRVIAAHGRGDENIAQAEQAKAAEMDRMIDKYGGLPAGKAMMEWQGVPVGPPRLPFRPLTEPQQADLQRELAGVL